MYITFGPLNYKCVRPNIFHWYQFIEKLHSHQVQFYKSLYLGFHEGKWTDEHLYWRISLKVLKSFFAGTRAATIRACVCVCACVCVSVCLCVRHSLPFNTEDWQAERLNMSWGRKHKIFKQRKDRCIFSHPKTAKSPWCFSECFTDMS